MVCEASERRLGVNHGARGLGSVAGIGSGTGVGVITASTVVGPMLARRLLVPTTDLNSANAMITINTTMIAESK